MAEPRNSITVTPIYSYAQWDTLLQSTISEITKLARVKGGEYAGDSDRLANFRRNGAALGLNPETIWAVYAGKHWDSIQQWIKDLLSGKERARAESMEGRVHDLITYSILLLAMMEERNGPRPEPVSQQEQNLAVPAASQIGPGIRLGERNWHFVMCDECIQQSRCEDALECGVTGATLSIKKNPEPEPSKYVELFGGTFTLYDPEQHDRAGFKPDLYIQDPNGEFQFFSLGGQ